VWRLSGADGKWELGSRVLYLACLSRLAEVQGLAWNRLAAKLRYKDSGLAEWEADVVLWHVENCTARKFRFDRRNECKDRFSGFAS
jgi:hypothetical protein